jgi:hypothetical protein
MGDLSEPRRATSAFGTSWTYDDVRELVVIGWKADVQRDDRVGRYFTDSSLVLRVITLNSFKRLIADRSDETRLARSRVFPRQLGHTLCARAPLVVYLLD